MATNDLVRFHSDVLNTILNGEKDDDDDEQGDLQFGHLLTQSVKLLRLQGDMTHQVCSERKDLTNDHLCVYFRNEQMFFMNFQN